MRTKNFNNILILSAANGALHILGIIYSMIITHFGGAEGMGVFQLVMPFYGLMRSFSIAGTTVAVSRLTAEHKNTDLHSRRLVSTAIAIFLTVFALAAVPIILLSDNIAIHLLGDERAKDALRLMLVCLLLTGFENIYKSYFYGIERVLNPIISDIIEQLVRIGAVAFLLARYGTGDSGMVATLVIGAMICSELVSASLMKILYEKNKSPLAEHHSYVFFLKSILAIAVPIAAGGLIDSLLGTATTLALPRRLVASGLTKKESIEALGILRGMVMPIMILPSIFIGSLCTITLPSIAQSCAAGNLREVRRKTVRAFTATGMLTFPLLGILVAVGADISYALYHQHGIQHYILPLAVSSAFMYFHMISISVLNSIGRQKASNVCSVVVGAIELVLVYVLAGMPRLGIYGYLSALIIGSSIAVLACVLLITSKLGLSLRAFKGVFITVIPAVFIALIAEIAYALSGSLVLSVGASLAVYGLIIRHIS